MENTIYLFENPEILAEQLSKIFYKTITNKSIFTVAFSGGKTPATFLKYLANPIFKEHFNVWNNIHVFQVDERMVPPDHSESNFKMIKELLVDKISIPYKNIHRIHGENHPDFEVKRYAEEIKQYVELENEDPVFDWIFLGLGEDGHTASIFPNRLDLINGKNICEITTHPITGQKRITITGKVIFNARRVSFIVTGIDKSKVVADILQHKPEADKYPASYFCSRDGITEWFLDKEAASKINS